MYIFEREAFFKGSLTMSLHCILMFMLDVVSLLVSYICQCVQCDSVDKADSSEVQDDGVFFCIFRILIRLKAPVYVTVGYCCYPVVIDNAFTVSFVATVGPILHRDHHFVC